MTHQATTRPRERAAARPQPAAHDGAELVLEDRFSMVPEWVLDADIGDCALRLYAVLLRYGNTTGARMPARTTLAARLHKKSTDTVDRALAELVQLGAVQVEHRWFGQQRLTNQYRIRTSRPHRRTDQAQTAPEPAPERGGRTDAATPIDTARGGRTNQTRVAARMRHDRESPTENHHPLHPRPQPVAPHGSRNGPTPPTIGGLGGRNCSADCGIHNDSGWDDYVCQVHRARLNVGQPLTRWAAAHLLTALDLAVRGRGWPPDRAGQALLQVAADPTTRSPARLAEAGPWWDEMSSSTPQATATLNVAALEDELDAVDGQRLHLQHQARQLLTAEGQPVTRLSVIQRAVELLHTTPHPSNDAPDPTHVDER